MSNHLSTIIISLALLLLSGCANVVSQHPIGTESYTASPDTWDGTWLSEGEFIKIKVIDAANGIVRLAWVEEKDNDFKFESFTCQIRKSKDGLYVNVQAKPDDSLSGFYYWGKLKKEDHKILFWLPSVTAFNEASEAGKIQAIIEREDPDKSGNRRIKNIKLVDDPQVISDLVEGDSGKYLDLEDPVVLVKVIK